MPLFKRKKDKSPQIDEQPQPVPAPGQYPQQPIPVQGPQHTIVDPEDIRALFESFLSPYIKEKLDDYDIMIYRTLKLLFLSNLDKKDYELFRLMLTYLKERRKLFNLLGLKVTSDLEFLYFLQLLALTWAKGGRGRLLLNSVIQQVKPPEVVRKWWR